MSAHVTRERLDRLRDGSLPPAEIAEVGGHASTCGTCGLAVGEALALDRTIGDLRVQIENGHEPDST